MIPSERLKALHELAAETRRQERELAERLLEDLRAGIERLTELVAESRLAELRWHMMSEAERGEHREIEREIEADKRDGDWTR